MEKTSFGFGKHIVALTISSLTENTGIEIAKHFKGCRICFTDGVQTYFLLIIGKFMQSLLPGFVDPNQG
jgi:hypothetical protein